MQTALRVTTRVLPGHRVEITAPELPLGEAVDVFVVMPTLTNVLPEVQPHAEERGSIWELIQSLPSGPRSASTWEEIEQNLQEDRNSWDQD